MDDPWGKEEAVPCILESVRLRSGYKTRVIYPQFFELQYLPWNTFLARLRLECILLSPGEVVEALKLGLNVKDPIFVPFYDGSCVSVFGWSKGKQPHMGPVSTRLQDMDWVVCISDGYLVCEP